MRHCASSTIFSEILKNIVKFRNSTGTVKSAFGSCNFRNFETRIMNWVPSQSLLPSSIFGFDFAALDLDCIQSASLGFGLYFRWIGLDPFQKIKQGLDLDWFWPARTWIWIASAQPCLGFGLFLGFGSVFNLLNLNQVTYRPPGKLPGAGEQSTVGGIEKCRAHTQMCK